MATLKEENWKELRALWNEGWALHWLRPNSKAPVKSKWTEGDRGTWEALRKDYRPGYNVGVRLGKASKLKDGTYLAAIDCDVKSQNPKHAKEMTGAVQTLLSSTDGTSPLLCLSGRGNGSKHLYVKVKTPLSPRRHTQSQDVVPVKMPSVKPSRADQTKLSSSEISSGLRMRAAWEISLMGEGQQIVLPPSIHPDSGQAYRWGKKGQPALFSPPPHPESALVSPAFAEKDQLSAFVPASVDLLFDPRNVPESLCDMILNGDGVTDRSASLLTVSKHLARLKFSENEILSVLSDRETYLGQCAYDHTGSGSRDRAVKWLRRFTTGKAVSGVREESAALEQALESVDELKASTEVEDLFGVDLGDDEDSWKRKLKRQGKNGEGPPQKTLENLLLILEHEVSPSLFRRDLFRNRDAYTVDAPWGGKAGQAVSDTDLNLIRNWLDTKFRIEPRKDLVDDAIDIMAARNSFHPIRDYLGALPPWDGVERLDYWLRDVLGAEGPEVYLAQAFRKWMVAAVTRVFMPGAQFDWMLVLEGLEGLGKSTFFRTLAGAEYFRDNLPDLRDKDSAQALDGIWIVELAEVEDYFRRNQREVFKAYLTRRVDKYRPAFARKGIEAHRQCVFAGSTNEERFLHSESGNRRVVPIKVGVTGGFDFHATGKARDQLWAEAMVIYKMGLEETLELEGEAKEHAKKLQTEEKRVLTEADLMAEQLLDFIDKVKKDRASFTINWDKFRIDELFEGSGPWVDSCRQLVSGRVHGGRAITKMGGVKFKSDGRAFWRLPPSNYLLSTQLSTGQK